MQKRNKLYSQGRGFPLFLKEIFSVASSTQSSSPCRTEFAIATTLIPNGIDLHIDDDADDDDDDGDHDHDGDGDDDDEEAIWEPIGLQV